MNDTIWKIYGHFKLFLLKAYQIVRTLLSLLWPDKTLSNRLCYGMALICTIIFLANAVFTEVYTVKKMWTEVIRRANREINLAQIIFSDAIESEDTVTTADVFRTIHERGIGDEFKICVTDQNDTVVASSMKSWLDKKIKTVENPYEIEGLKLYPQKINDTIYICTIAGVDSLPFRIVLAQPAEVAYKPLIEVLTETAKWSGLCFIILIFCYLVILGSLKNISNRNNQIEGELGVAANIQQQMLPKDFSLFPWANDFDLYCFLQPAKEMGGDLYDFVMKDNKLFFCVGDVSGKGMPAALFMSETRILFRHVLNFAKDPADMASAINNSLSEGNDSNMFCTLFLGELDFCTGILRYCNAGHNAPAIQTAEGNTSFLNVQPNIALGLFAGFPYQTQEMVLLPGMSLFVYTDGVTEAESLSKQLFSDETVLEVLSQCKKQTPKEIIDTMLARIQLHSRMNEQSDDITMLCLKDIRI